MRPRRSLVIASSFLALVAALVAGCSVRSISDSGYPGGRTGNPFYRGELTEFDVLGDAEASDAEIAQRLAAYKRLRLVKGSSILLIQSGAPLPDDGMSRALGVSFAVTPFSGVPPTTLPANAPAERRGSYLRMLRTAAAHSGSPTILCYWGVIEAATQGEATKAVSWVPVAGSLIPDETQHMRIRLKLLLIDVATGDWASVAPTPVTDAAISASFNRAGVDQAQVALLKDQAYRAAADEVARTYSP